MISQPGTSQSGSGHGKASSGVYALIGISLVLRQEVAKAPARVRVATEDVVRARDLWVTTTLQLGHEARERVVGFPASAGSAVKAGRTRARRDVIDLRDDASRSFDDLAHRGRRAADQWQAERILNQRTERFTRSVTPGLAKAGVSVRDSSRAATASAPAMSAKRFGATVRTNVSKTWGEYLVAVDEAGGQNS